MILLKNNDSLQYGLKLHLFSILDQHCDEDKLKNGDEHIHISSKETYETLKDKQNKEDMDINMCQYRGTFCLTELNIAVSVSRVIIPIPTL